MTLTYKSTMFKSFMKSIQENPNRFSSALGGSVGGGADDDWNENKPPRKIIQLSDHMMPLNYPNMMNGISSIYYLNMNKSTNRRNHIESVLNGEEFKNIPKVRIEAVDGKSPDFLVENYFDFYGGTQKNPRMLPTEYATTLSHIRAIQQFVEDSYSMGWDDDTIGLVVEDDMSSEFLPYWRTDIDGLVRNRAPKDWEILQVSYILFEFAPKEEFEQWMMNKNMCGTAAYFIRLCGAKRLMDYLCKYSSPTQFRYCIGPEYPFYHHTDRFLYSFLRTYGVNPPLFTYRDSNDSSIHPDHVNFHANSKEKTKKLWLGWDLKPL